MREIFGPATVILLLAACWHPSKTPVCGNGAVEGTEGCDDGGTATGDGCSDTCTVEPGWTCGGEPSSCTAFELCANLADDDGDGHIDCADQDCFGDSACQGTPPEVCDDGVDNDGDGWIDCADPECLDDPVACRLGEVCGIPGDEDGDGVADCMDPECRGTSGPTCPSTP